MLTPEEFMATLDGALLALHDSKHGVLFVWYGGHGVHGYMPSEAEWKEVIFYNTGDFAKENAAMSDVIQSIEERMQQDDEEFWC